MLHGVFSKMIGCATGVATRPLAVLDHATSHIFPEGPTVSFLNGPFGPPLLERALNNTEASLHASPRDSC